MSKIDLIQYLSNNQKKEKQIFPYQETSWIMKTILSFLLFIALSTTALASKYVQVTNPACVGVAVTHIEFGIATTIGYLGPNQSSNFYLGTSYGLIITVRDCGTYLETGTYIVTSAFQQYFTGGYLPCDSCDPCSGQGGDSDGDGICNNTDNCPNDYNPNQADSDNDGIGDACDVNCPTISITSVTNPENCKINTSYSVSDGSNVMIKIQRKINGSWTNLLNWTSISANPYMYTVSESGDYRVRLRSDNSDCYSETVTNYTVINGVSCIVDPCAGQGGDSDGDGICNNVDNCVNNPNSNQADSDNDNVGNACDNCPNDFNPNQADSDNDGIGDVCDDPCDNQGGDSDGDGICNNVDNCVNTPNSNQADNDNDNVGNACDNCPNDFNPNQADSDNDGIGDVCDDPCDNQGGDSDGDGICNNVDNCVNTPNSNQADNDNDNVGNACDNCPNDFNPNQADSDNDGIGDVCDNPCDNQGGDSDGDGICNNVDNCVNNPNSNQADSDNDNVGNVCDNCPNTYNPNQADSDNDGIGDACEQPTCMVTIGSCTITISGLNTSDQAKVFDSNWNVVWQCNSWVDVCNPTEIIDVGENGTYWVQACGSTTAYFVSGCTSDPCANQGGDSDDDGICNNVDNCVNTPNSNQADNDNDNVGNACDNCPNHYNPNQADSDNDGIGDACEAGPCDNQGGDSDGDGVCNNVDNCVNTPNSNQADNDNDNVGNACDNCPNTYNPNQADSDNDGIGDACEQTGCSVTTGTCSITISGLNASDHAKIFNSSWQVIWECNPWGSGMTCNATEVVTNLENGTYWVQACGSTESYTVSGCGTDPCAGQGGDSDNDGVCNNVDNCVNTPNANQMDSDNDNVGNACDNCPNDYNPNQADSDNDGIGDACEGGPCDNQGGDSDGDGVCNDVDNCVNTPNSNQMDSDNDNVGNACDNCPNTYNPNQADSDNDGVGDACEQTGCSVTTGTCSIIISGLNTSDHAKVFDSNWQVIWECNPWGSGMTCSSTETITNLENGTYWVQACGSNTSYSVSGCGGGCDNVTDGGEIQANETNTSGYDPAAITNVVSPSGGSGQIEYIWLSSTTGCPDNINLTIPGATGSSYDPGFITQTTYFVRCSRRAGCTGPGSWVESNCIIKEVDAGGGGPNCNTISVTTGVGSITVSNLTAPNVIVKVFDSSWNTIFNGVVTSSSEVFTGLSAGNYQVYINYYNSSWGSICNVNFPATVSNGAPLQSEGTESLFFVAQKDRRDVMLNWVINTDYKSEYFEVERSFDGINFEVIEEVNSIGESIDFVTYQTKDFDAQIGINYYRIKQLFHDGTYRFSDIAQVAFELDVNKFVVFPNPATDEIFVNLKDFVGNAGVLQIHNGLGQTVFSQDLGVIPTDPVHITLAEMKAGVHFISVKVEGHKLMTEKLIIVKR